MNKRIQIDIKELYDNPIENAYFYINETNITNIKFMIIGPKDTPYEHGCYIFDLNIQDKYPFYPPKVEFLSTNGKIRFHPFLYENGKVCLSILNTWSGPQWTSIQTLYSILLSIQSIFCKNPLLDEPGHRNDDLNNIFIYNNIIEYNKYAYSIIYQLNKKQYDYFYDIQKKYFTENYNIIHKNIIELQSIFFNNLIKKCNTHKSNIEIQKSDDKINWTNTILYFKDEKYKINKQILKKINNFKLNTINTIDLSKNDENILVYIKIIKFNIYGPKPFSGQYCKFDYNYLIKKIETLYNNIE